MSFDLPALQSFIVAAKAACYVGNGRLAEPSRPSSHDLTEVHGDWSYRDSYFGGTDFIGQEVVWYREDPVWAMNYYGYILRDDLIDARRAGATIKAALSQLYKEARFLGGLEWQGPHGLYCDVSSGDVEHFAGTETITVDGTLAYRLDYHGGLIRP